jgi:hypothetical protein
VHSDAALVLGHSIRQVHSETNSKGGSDKYSADLIALVTPNVLIARPILQAYGWRVVEKPLPVQEDEIENTLFAQQFKSSSKEGMFELMRLWTFAFTGYHRVVYLDVDSLVLRNLDELFDDDHLELQYTGDFEHKEHSPAVPIRDSFLIVKPSIDRFEQIKSMIKKGKHNRNGWFDSRIGNFWGGQTLKGLLPYVYYAKHKGKGKLLDSCKYHNLAASPHRPGTKKCWGAERNCPDCRLTNITDVLTLDYSACGQPWLCSKLINKQHDNQQACKAMHQKWFEVRDDLERTHKVDLSYRFDGSKTAVVWSIGMCAGWGDQRYLPIPLNKIGKDSLIYDTAIYFH